jgi:hypothetical protein
MEALQTFEHNGKVLRLFPYEAESPKPARASSLRTPGAGRFEINRIDLAREDGGLTLTAQVGGRNIAYIYTEILHKDPTVDRYYGPVAREHVQANRNKESRGISRPDWDDPVDLAVALRPSLRLLTDGVDWAFCFSIPESYGNPGYRLAGLYTPAGGAAPLRAGFTFDSAGGTKRILAYKEQGGRSTPRALTPKQGDRFSPFVQVLTPPAEGGDWEVATALSGPLTFRDERFRVVTETPMAGDYLVGLLVQDLDGRLTRKYVPLAIGESLPPGLPERAGTVTWS